MSKNFTLIGLALLAGLQACGTTGSGLLYIEPSIKRQEIAIAKVAIVPNRLPLNLQDPEKWRRYNWGVARDEFAKRGFKVVGYETTVKLFDRSGLPVEDTKSSREKYAALAKVMGADAIIVPYYGTFAVSKNFLIFTNNSFVSVGTFQIFLAKQNDFFARVDVNGKNQYTSNLGFATIALSLVDPTAGSIGGLGALIYELAQALKSSDSRWKAAFKKGIQEGLKPFFASYPSPQSLPFSSSSRFDDTPREESEEFPAARKEREAVYSERAMPAPNRLGFLGGLSLARISQNPANAGFGFTTQSGFGAGTFYERHAGDNVAIRFESNYIQKGGEFFLSDENFRGQGAFKLAYIETATLLSISPGRGAIRPYIMAGPAVGYLASARIVVSNGAGSVDAATIVNKIDYGLIFGGGIRFDFIFIEGRYALGLTDISQDDDVEDLNRGIQIMAGLSLPMRR